MALLYYKADTDSGGVKGSSLPSGVRGAILPDLSNLDRVNGIEIYRKFYTINTGDDEIALKIALDDYGLFDAIIFESTGDAMVVGDILGTEDKYGAAIVVKLEDTTTASETTNNTGGLIDIKKITVETPPNYTIFRAGDKIGMGGALGEIATISSVAVNGSETEITLSIEITYDPKIGSFAHSYIEKSIISTEWDSYWVLVKVAAGSSSTATLNGISLATVY